MAADQVLVNDKQSGIFRVLLRDCFTLLRPLKWENTEPGAATTVWEPCGELASTVRLALPHSATELI